MLCLLGPAVPGLGEASTSTTSTASTVCACQGGAGHLSLKVAGAYARSSSHTAGYSSLQLQGRYCHTTPRPPLHSKFVYLRVVLQCIYSLYILKYRALQDCCCKSIHTCTPASGGECTLHTLAWATCHCIEQEHRYVQVGRRPSLVRRSGVGRASPSGCCSFVRSFVTLEIRPITSATGDHAPRTTVGRAAARHPAAIHRRPLRTLKRCWTCVCGAGGWRVGCGSWCCGLLACCVVGWCVVVFAGRTLFGFGLCVVVWEFRVGLQFLLSQHSRDVIRSLPAL